MGYPGRLTEWYGLPVHDFPVGPEGDAAALPEPDAVAWRISADPREVRETWPEVFARFRAAVDTARVRSLVVGCRRDTVEVGPDEVNAAIVEAREQFPALRAVFLGDMDNRELEISAIHQGDAGRLLEGLPELEELGVRGGSGLEFRALTHRRLRSLVVQTGGMPAAAVRGIAGSGLPALEHLELWLGTSWFGGDCEIGDLSPVFDGSLLPRLRRLGLRNSDIQDEIAAAAAAAPVVARLEHLDLSLGVLTDEGARALLAGRPPARLKSLDLHHNYIGEPLRQRLKEVFEGAGVALDIRPGHAGTTEYDGEVTRYVAVGE
ncbi:leucine-rich repeat domain-containing protein [Streptomyces globosus]|uniref:Leucine-rich repeat domain-containing protein n=1 Tax=Streptomyces globosus TaxID=68209 RepID=A0A344U0S0_9ACTN|nr:STM4015 family protein [Streptomyces globosus]AXE24491.1 leucine-rich repeat domain-containing protein [Streptomyces globosus]